MKAWVAAVALLLAPELCLAETYPWETLSTPHYTLFYGQGDHLVARAVAAHVEEFHDKVAADLGGVTHRPIKLYLAPTREVFTSVLPKGSYVPMWAVAVAYPDLDLIVARSPRSIRRGRIDLSRTVTHEIAHVLLAKAVGPGAEIPKWLNEGFAMYEAEQWGFGEMATMTRISLANQFIPLEELARAFPGERHAAAAAYAQSFSVCAFLMDEYGAARFHQFIRSLGEYNHVSMAMKSSFGITLRQLEKAWHRHIRRRYTWIPVVTGTSTMWAVAGWLFLAGYLRKRAWQRRRMREMEMEEEEGEKQEAEGGRSRKPGLEDS